jgi:hypothetical protein
MADLATAAEGLTRLAAAVTRAWDGLREAWQDADAERFEQMRLAGTTDVLGRLAEDIDRLDAACREARQELAEE